MKNKIILVALAATTQIHASGPGGRVIPTYNPNTGTTLNIPGKSPASMSGSSGNILGQKNTPPAPDQTQPGSTQATTPGSQSMMTGSSPAVYASTPTSGMTAANQIVTANVPAAAPKPGSDPKTWAPLTVNDVSGNAIGTARPNALTSGIATGIYQPIGQDAQQAVFVDQGALQKVGSLQTKDQKMFDVYIINPNPVTINTPSSGSATAPQDDSGDSGNEDDFDFSDEDDSDDDTNSTQSDDSTPSDDSSF